MNKKLTCLLAAVLLAGCSGAVATVSDPDAPLMTIGDMTFTKGEEYSCLKLSNGPNLVMQMVEGDIYDKEVGRDEAIVKEAESTWNEYAKSDSGLEEYIQSLGYADKQDYIDQVLVPSIQAEKLLNKWFEENAEAVKDEYKPSKAQIIQVTDEEAGKKAIEAIKDGKSASEAFKDYGVADSTYNGEADLVTTMDTGLPTRMINSLAAAKKPGLLNEVFNQDGGAYYVAVLVSNEYDDLKDELVSTLKNDSSVSEKCLVFYLKKYDFQVYDQDIFNYLKANYPQYLVTRPDLSEDKEDN